MHSTKMKTKVPIVTDVHREYVFLSLEQFGNLLGILFGVQRLKKSLLFSFHPLIASILTAAISPDTCPILLSVGIETTRHKQHGESS